jgi:hypothetical protein
MPGKARNRRVRVSGKIYLLQEDGTLQSLEERAYASEALLQRLLEDYPDLLAGD